ncbi:MAG: hypothetical protein OXN80_02170 [bacterium]|nr:hypothetical protein [bacterium]
MKSVPFGLPWRMSLGALLIISAVGACAEAPAPTTTVAPVVTSAPTTTVAPVVTSAPTTTVAPVVTSAPTTTIQAKSPAQVYADVSPSVAFVSTPVGSGSGLLIEGGYVVTNHHVIWPYEKARVVFSDGTEFPDVQVRPHFSGVDIFELVA